MTSLITCCNLKFLDKAIKCLESSFLVNGNIKHCLYFIGDKINYNIPSFIEVKYVPDTPSNLSDIYLFAYKYWCILEEFKTSDIVLYTDSTHLIKKSFDNIDEYFYKDCFVLPYNNGQFLIKNWTTKYCIKQLQAESYLDNPQIWAGFQGYKKSLENIKFINNILNLCLDSSLSSPYPWVKNPDGEDSQCLYHRNDQSILSIELLKNNTYPEFLIQKDHEFGDNISVKYFYPEQYTGDVLNTIYRVLYPRYFK